MRIIGMKQIWVSSGAEIKDVTVTERGLLLLLSVIQISHADFSTSHLLLPEHFTTLSTHLLLEAQAPGQVPVLLPAVGLQSRPFALTI